MTVYFAPTELTTLERQLQAEVSDYLDKRLVPGSYQLGLGMPGSVDKEFSRDLGRQGWLGMSLPREYGGHGRSAVDRLVVVEQLIARGAPLGYHWFGDRQCGPSIAANGSEALKRELLPGIVSGELSFSIGMSEPDSGSDLASVRTRAVRRGDEWVVNGTKIWTSLAATATHLLALFRTSDDRHHGLTQFVVDCGTPGLTVSPIQFIDGTSEFCELSFVDVVVPDARRLGEIGSGWSQNTGELALERGGVDRWMSVMPILEHWARAQALRSDGSALEDLGTILAKCWSYRGLSLSVARTVDEGRSAVIEAALVKEMACRFEQECVELVVRSLGRAPDPSSDDAHEALLARALLVAPSWTIRGGTTEILRSVIMKGLRTA